MRHPKTKLEWCSIETCGERYILRRGAKSIYCPDSYNYLADPHDCRRVCKHCGAEYVIPGFSAAAGAKNPHLCPGSKAERKRDQTVNAAIVKEVNAIMREVWRAR